MRHSVYRYNAETCQYEHVRVKPRDIVSYTLGILVSALAMLVGLLMLHDFVFDTQKEKALRKENAALRKNSSVLTNQLTSIESTLAFLHREDKKLHKKFFGEELISDTEKDPDFTKQRLLLADASAFTEAVESIGQQTSSLIQRSAHANSYFVDKISVEKEKVTNLDAVPSLQPVKLWHLDKLISGFGTRVNPFHKGLYEHSGVDISMPRGTEVIATASGMVTLVKQSDLQAGYGNYIEIDHGQGFITRYAHLEEIKVRIGQKINKGNVIASIGNSGGSIAPHLHYEIILNGKNVDPVVYMMQGLSSEEHHHMKLISQNQNQSLD